MLNLSTHGRNVFTMEQKIKEFKKILFRSKALQNCKGERLQQNKLIQKAINI